MTMTFNQALSRRGTVQLYGTPIPDLPATDELGLGISNLGPIGFAQIRAFSFGKRCIELPLPAILTVFGPGRAPETWDTCARDKERVWEVGHGDPAVLVDFRRGTTLELLDDVETRGIDGGVALENPRVENGQICATLHVWARIEIFGASASIDERIPVCIPLEGCVTVYEFGFGNVQACVAAAPPNGVKVCLKLCVGKWGLEKCWDACSYVGLPRIAAPAVPSPIPCPCKG